MSNSNNTNLDKDKVIVRISAQGQYKINSEILRKIDQIDDSIVDIIENIQSDEISNNNYTIKEKELSEKIQQIIDIVTSQGSQLDDKELLQSDIMIPSADISIEEAKKIFRDEGIIPDI